MASSRRLRSSARSLRHVEHDQADARTDTIAATSVKGDLVVVGGAAWMRMLMLSWAKERGLPLHLVLQLCQLLAIALLSSSCLALQVCLLQPPAAAAQSPPEQSGTCLLAPGQQHSRSVWQQAHVRATSTQRCPAWESASCRVVFCRSCLVSASLKARN